MIETDIPNNELDFYLQDIGQVPLLTAAEEMTLGRAVSEGKAARNRLVNINGDTEARTTLLGQIHLGENARKRLIESNLRLVISVAKRYQGYGLPLIDLIQEGNLGLIRAADKFDYKRGFKFGTFATWSIRYTVGEAVQKHSRNIRRSADFQKKLKRIGREEQALAQELGRNVDLAELAESLGMSVAEIQELRAFARDTSSLDQPVIPEESNSDTVGDLIANNDPPIDEAFLREEFMQETKQVVNKVLDTLNPRQRVALMLFYGFDDDENRNLTDIGNELNTTREGAIHLVDVGRKNLRHGPQRAILGTLK